MESKTNTFEANIDPVNLYKLAVEERPEYFKYSQNEIKRLISDTVSEIDMLEKIGEKEREKITDSPGVLQNIAVVWVISGPGTYDLPTKEDKYKDLEWAKGMDRARLNHGAVLARAITKARSGPLEGSLMDIVERKRKTKEIIKNYGPEIVYNGTEQENDTVFNVLSRKGVVIPEEKVHIIRGDIETTLDQVKTFKLPVELKENEELAIISHAPHLARIMHMINKHKPFPEGTRIRLFPVPTPENGKEEYAKMETLGLLRYIYLDNEATIESYPYNITSAVR